MLSPPCRMGKGRVHSVRMGGRATVHEPLFVFGRQQAQVALARLVRLPVVDDGPSWKHVALHGG